MRAFVAKTFATFYENIWCEMCKFRMSEILYLKRTFSQQQQEEL